MQIKIRNYYYSLILLPIIYGSFIMSCSPKRQTVFPLDKQKTYLLSYCAGENAPDTINNGLFKTRVRRVGMVSLQQSQYIWMLISVLLLFTIVFIYLYMRRQRTYLIEKYRNRIVELRMENIRNRVSPHFIFNILNHTISRFDKNDKNYQELFNLIKLMRLNLSLSEKLKITLEEELEFVSTYILTRQQESGMQIEFTTDIDSLINTAAIEIPSMIIQIPVENSIKHGFRDNCEYKYIKISALNTSTDTIIKIADNGSGFYAKQDNCDIQSTGTGLKVINQTIELLNIYNKNKISFTIESRTENGQEDSGCTVTYIIPKEYNYTLNNKN